MSVVLRLPAHSIARELGVDRKTVLRDIAEEHKLRNEELAAEKDVRRQCSIATYNRVIREMLQHLGDPRFGPKAAAEITRAQQQIDKLLGIDEPAFDEPALDERPFR